MTVVVDASVALKWTLAEPGRAAAVALRDGRDELVAPDLLAAEVADVLWQVVQRGGMELDRALEALDALVGSPLALVATVPLLPPAVRLAETLDEPTYDCCYLALAERLGGALATADRRLAEAARGRDVAVRAVAA